MMTATLKGKHLLLDLRAEAEAERQERVASTCPMDGSYSQRNKRLLDLRAEKEVRDKKELPLGAQLMRDTLKGTKDCLI